MNMLTVISNFLIIMSSSSNFFVYLCKDHKFLVILNRCVSASVESSFGDSTCPVMRQDTVVSKYEIFYIFILSGLHYEYSFLITCQIHCLTQSQTALRRDDSAIIINSNLIALNKYTFQENISFHLILFVLCHMSGALVWLFELFHLGKMIQQQ